MVPGLLENILLDAMWKHVDAVPGWLTREEAEILFALACSEEPPSLVVELGAWQGRSTVCLALALKVRAALAGIRDPRPMLISVDHHHGSPEHQPGMGAFDPSVYTGHEVDTWPAFIRNLEAHGVADWVLALREDTATAGEVYGWRVGMLYIDAQHTEEAVLRDALAWRPRIVSGGIVAFHDWGCYPGVTMAVARLVDEHGWIKIGTEGTLAVLMPPDSTGFGVGSEPGGK